MRSSLDKAITKWRKIVESTKAIDHDNCALCDEFGKGGSCWYCPVYKRIKERGCEGTPWEKWAIHQTNSHGRQHEKHREPYCRKCLKLAKEELKFLEGLK